MFVPYFSLQENYGSPGQKDHEVPIDVKAMSEYGSFKFRSELRIEGAFQSSLTRLSIRLQEQHYHYRSSYTAAQTQRMEPFLSISGFPRKLWAQNICPTPVDNEPGSDLEADATAKSERLEGKVETPLETPDEEGPRSPGGIKKLLRMGKATRSGSNTQILRRARSSESNPRSAGSNTSRLQISREGLVTRGSASSGATLSSRGTGDSTEGGASKSESGLEPGDYEWPCELG